MKHLSAVAVLLFVLATPAFADDTAIQGIGGAVAAMKEHPSVVMDKMEVTVDLYPTRAQVECRFVFRNTGPAVSVRMGFPEAGNQAGRRTHPPGFTAFATTVDGKRVPTTTEGYSVNQSTGRWRRWRVKTVHFSPGQTRRVTVNYTAPLGEYSTGEERFFQYQVTTGGSWKGPMGSARMLIRGHYDPDRSWLKAPADFRRTGPTTFEWSARDVEPKREVHLVYSLGVEVRVVGYPMSAGNQPPYSYVKGGEVWGPVRMLANWLRAEMEVTGADVTLVRGRRYVAICRGNDWIDDNGRRVVIREPVHIVQGRFVVPLAPTAGALGATVAYDPTTRVTDITFTPLSFLPRPGPEQRSAFTAIPVGFAPPELSDYDPDVAADLRRQGLAHPWGCVGDFNGDSFEDIALLVRRTSSAAPDDSGIIVLPGDRFGWQRFHWLWGAPGKAYEAPGKLITVLRTYPPGEVAYYQEGETTPKSGRLQLKRDGIAVIAWGKAASLCHWEETAKRYDRVTIAD